MMTYETLKEKLKALAYDVCYPEPSVQEEETDDTWVYSVSSQECCWHDESKYDGNRVMLSLRKPGVNTGAVPVQTSDRWLGILAGLLSGVEYRIASYHNRSDDDWTPLYHASIQHIVELIPGTEKGVPVWLKIESWGGRG